MSQTIPDYIFHPTFFKRKNYKKILEVFKYNSNMEVGGYRVYNGTGDHSLQCPEELLWIIKELKQKEKKFKIKNYLEFGYANGITNTILNKFFCFNKIVSVDLLDASAVSKDAFFVNLKFKNFILLCGNSTSKFIHEQIKLNSKYDLIFIDGGHDYEIVKNDFDIALKNVNKNGTIIFHDIAASSCHGPKKLWGEIKKKFDTKEFVSKKYFIKYGFGIINIK